MSTAKSLTNIFFAMIAIAALGAIALVPLAGFSSVAIARTHATMESNIADLTDGRGPGVTTIKDADDNVLAFIYKQRRFDVPSEKIAQPIKDAIVSVEDRRFYEHDGVDFPGFFRALATNLLAGGVEQGASTINQQYVKNYLLLADAKDESEQEAATETSIPRKLREMRMAANLDKTLTKDEILTRYLNIVPFGNGAYGVEAAAQTYFGISAAELSVPQAAMLAGIVQSSSFLNPYTNQAGVIERRNTVLQAMVDAGRLSPEDEARFSQEPLGVLDTPRSLPNGCITAGDRGFFCDYALKYLAKQGLSKETLEKGAYTIKLTLDPKAQDAARKSVSTHTSPTADGVAEVVNVVEPGSKTHNILAMASSRNYGLNLEAGETVLPQPSSMVGNGVGSVFKVFTAAAAIEDGMDLGEPLDVPRRYQALGLGTGGAANCPTGYYCVENSGNYAPKMSLQEVLAHSPNTPFVKLIEKVGVDKVVDLSVALGLKSYAEPGSFDGESSIADYMKNHNLGSYTLGPTAVNPLELSNVGATIASGGMWCEPNPVASVHDRNGNEVYIDRPLCERAISEDVAKKLSVGLSLDSIEGTASKAARSYGWNKKVSAKTGTTESNQSSAFLGFNNKFSAAPYVYNDGKRISPLCGNPVRQCVNGNLFGGDAPAQTWFQMAKAVPQALSGTIPEDNRNYRLRKPESSLPKVIGLMEEEARKILEDARYTVTVRTVPSNQPKGQVVNVIADPRATGPNSPAVLEVSDGTGAPTPGHGPAPNIQDGIDAFNDAIRGLLGR